MKNKIIGIFVCMLLIAAAVLPVAGTINIDKKQEKSEFEEQSTMAGGTFEIKQWGSPYTHIIDPIEGPQSAKDFYDYSAETGHPHQFSGDTPYMEDYVSKIYLYRQTGNDKNVSLIIHHCIDGSNAGECREIFYLNGSVLEDSRVWTSVSDDHGEFYHLRSLSPEGSWTHETHSDGGVVGGIPTEDEAWDIYVDPKFNENITKWQYQLEDKVISLEMDKFIRISYKPPCGIIDQKQENTDEIHWLEHTVPNWQQFVNHGKTLCAVELHIGCYFSGSAAITLSIEETVGGSPLTQVTYAATDLPDNTQAWFSFDVPDVELECNKMYYIVLRFDIGSEYGWSGTHGDPYPAGISSHPDDDWDFAFRTIVDEICSPPLELKIVVDGGFLGYTVTVTNLGDEPVNGSLDITVTTDATFTLLGEELSFEGWDFALDPPNPDSRNLMPVLGFGPATITVEATAETPDVIEAHYSGNATGFVFLIFVVGSCELTPDPIP